MNRKRIRLITLGVSLVCFLFSAYKLGEILLTYRQGNSEYNAVEDMVLEEVIVIGEEEPRTAYKVDFQKLLQKNAETVGWIRFEEPAIISYPVVQTKDNDKYLHTTFEGKKNAVGAIFMDAGNAKDFSDRVTFIYGHNMKNGSMFGKLRNYRKEEFCSKHPFFYIYKPESPEERYQVFAVCVIEDSPEYYQSNFATDEEFLSYLKRLQKSSIHKTDVQINESSHIVVLSTCTNATETQRLIVCGVKTEE